MTALQRIETSVSFNVELAAYIDGEQSRELAERGRAWSYYYAAKQFVSFLSNGDAGLLDGLTEYVAGLRRQQLPANTYNHRIAAAKHLVRHIIATRQSEMTATDRAGLLELLADVKLAKIDKGALEVGGEKYLSADELRAFITRCEDTTIKLMAIFLQATGARVSEMLRVKLSDIKCNKKTCTVRLHGKGDKERSAIISAQKIDIIRDHFAGTTWLFEHNDKQYSRTSVAQRFRFAGHQILQRNITPHMFRHSYATLKYEETNDLVGVQRALGHSSVSTTESMYVHHSLADNERELVLEDEAETLDELSQSVTSESVRRDSEHFAIKDGRLVQPDPKESAAVEKLLQKTFQERYRAPR